ncbi:MAG: methyltransferase domain-containing protein [Betaproteobacteria bacterium]|nr:methyltransferase domain-containing protein [Betaproteobacteria bacterium]
MPCSGRCSPPRLRRSRCSRCADVAQDSSKAEFWDVRFRGGVTPWDAGGVPPRLATWLAVERERLRVLIPGCGTGYEARAFHERGHEVVAIDFSDAALEAARRELGALAHLASRADFFAFETVPFDLIYERALLCALPRARWQDWAQRVAELTRPSGRLAGFFFTDDNQRGPPFGIGLGELDLLLSEAFFREQDIPIPPEQSLRVFQGKERWQVWRRKL